MEPLQKRIDEATQILRTLKNFSAIYIPEKPNYPEEIMKVILLISDLQERIIEIENREKI